MTLAQSYNNVVIERDALKGEVAELEGKYKRLVHNIKGMLETNMDRGRLDIEVDRLTDVEDNLMEYLKELEHQRDQLRKVLERVEWVEMSRFGDGKFLHQCPVCLTVTGHEHYSDCELHAVLKSAGEGDHD